MFFPPKNGVPIFAHPDLTPAERNWHREAILACASRLAKAKPLLAAGCSSRQKIESVPIFAHPDLTPAERNWHREAILACVSRLAKAKPLLAAGCSSRQKIESVPIFAHYFCASRSYARGAELASRSDTGLRKQTGKGEAFTGGGMFFPPKNRVCPYFCANLHAASNWQLRLVQSFHRLSRHVVFHV